MSEVSDEKEAKIQSLKNKIIELEQEVANKQKMVATVSHELRTPMGAIISMAELLCENCTDGAQKKYADTLKLSANSLLSIVNQLLDDSKANASLTKSNQNVFSLHDLIKSTAATLEARLVDQPINITLSQCNALPDTVAGDAGKLNQILNNLIDNAVKFTQVGEIALSAELIEEYPETHKIRFTLQDTGLGIEPEARQKIFSPYTQADKSISSEYGGTGLGLSICQELVENMGGEINCDSNPGLGSVFTFTIQLKPVCEVSHDTSELPASENYDGVPHILVVDDNQVNQMLISTYLEKADLSFSMAHNGKQALDMLQKEHFDLVLMDVQMPEMDGIEATKHIREMPQPLANIPIIALTANAMAGDREKYLASGMDDYLAKPVTAETLFRMINKYTQQPADNPQLANG